MSAPLGRSLRSSRSDSDERDATVSFQSYLDNIEEKTGLTPRQFMQLAHERGLDEKGVKAGAILEWLKNDYDLGRGHGMSLVHVIQNGAQISDKHVGTGTTHSDPKNHLWLDGVATKPEGY